MVIKHIKGTHFSIPPQLGIYFGDQKHIWEVEFTDAAYDLQGEDQWDWNKLLGISYSINAQKESAMVGWRYNTQTQKFELCAYCHVDGKRIYTKKLFEVKAGWKFVVSIEVKDGYYLFSMVGVSHTEPFYHNRKVSRRVNSWFGGNQKAPRTIKIKIEKA